MKRFMICLACVLTAGYAHSESPSTKEAPWLWVYAPINFLVNDNVDRLIELMGRAKKPATPAWS